MNVKGDIYIYWRSVEDFFPVDAVLVLLSDLLSKASMSFNRSSYVSSTASQISELLFETGKITIFDFNQAFVVCAYL